MTEKRSALTSLETQPEKLDVMSRRSEIKLGIPNEGFKESRIPLIPRAVKLLVNRGFHIVVQRHAGETAGYTASQFSEAGAEIVEQNDEVFKADVILKCGPPHTEELPCYRPNHLILSPMQFTTLKKPLLEEMLKKQVNAVAFEYLQDDDGNYPVVRTVSEMVGITAIMKAGELLSNIEHGRGKLLGGIAGVPPAMVVILGAGLVAQSAARAALGMGAEIKVFDNNITKLMRLRNELGRGFFTSTIDETILGNALSNCDVALGAIHSPEGRSPLIVTENMIRRMKEGSVVVDISIDQGGCFETSAPTTHERPTFIKHGVVHYCVPNIASSVPKTASQALSNILTPILLRAQDTMDINRLVEQNRGLRHGLYTFKGKLTKRFLAERFDLKYTDLDLIIPSIY